MPNIKVLGNILVNAPNNKEYPYRQPRNVKNSPMNTKRVKNNCNKEENEIQPSFWRFDDCLALTALFCLHYLTL